MSSSVCFKTKISSSTNSVVVNKLSDAVQPQIYNLLPTCTLQEKTLFATTKVVGKCQKSLQKIFTPITKKSLLAVAISSVAKSFAAKFNIVAFYSFFPTKYLLPFLIFLLG
jgi:hypothetical protein